MPNFKQKLAFSFLSILTLIFSILPQANGQSPCDVMNAREAKDFIDKTPEGTRPRTLDLFTGCKQDTDFKSPSWAPPKAGSRTNGLANFCVIVDDKDEPEASRTGDYGGPQDSNHFKILKQLAKKGAWSNQPTDNLPSSIGDGQNNFVEFGYPEQGAHNPYYIEVTGISVKGDLLHNWLHFRVFLNRSESLGFDNDGGGAREIPQNKRDEALNSDGKNEKSDNSRGAISALLMMVKDQDGWPIGDFSQDIPCYRTCGSYPTETYYGDKTNALPCAFTPPRANSHPGMFVYDADPGFYDEDELTTDRPGRIIRMTTTEITLEPDPEDEETTTTPKPVVKPDPNPIPPLKFPIPEKSRRKGPREVHATWSFNQDSCNFASKIYIQTLILEDVRHPIIVRAGNSDTGPTNAGNINPKLFGWTGQYNILLPTKSSLGAKDYVDLEYLKKRDLRVPDVDCHVPMFDAPTTFFNGFLKGQVPQHSTDNDVPVPTIQQYMYGLQGVIGTDREYYGQHKTESKCNGQGENIPEDDPDARKRAIPPVRQFIIDDNSNVGIRCPCPSMPSTLPPENATIDPTLQHGRLIHASHMAIAYMLLTPLACFVARYYKETFVTVFCFQEYWWYMWHVVLLIVACVFNFGAVLSIARSKNDGRKASDNIIVHVVLGSMSIFVFYMEIFTGFFRVADPQKRLRQIFMHWLIGCVNNVCAVGSMFAMAWVNDSGMSCSTVYTVFVWLLFVIGCYVIMELDMRKTDKKLQLVPKRSYLPPPVVRLFTRDAPGRNFRMLMLGVFVVGLIVLQLLVSYYIWHSGGDSCSQEWASFIERGKDKEIADDYTDDGSNDGDDDGGKDDTES